MTPTLLLAAAILLVGVSSGIVIGLKLAGRRITVVEVPAPFIPPSAQLSAALNMVAARDLRIEVLESVTVVPVSAWSVLPWQVIPDPVVVFREQTLMDEVQNLQHQLLEMAELLAVTERRRAQHWGSLRRLRARMPKLVDVAELAYTEALRMRSLSVAKTAQSRAAELSTALSEVEVARMEAMTLEEFNESFEAILGNHGIEVSA